MGIKRPSLAELEKLAQKSGLELNTSELEVLQHVMHGTMNSYDRIDQLKVPVPSYNQRQKGYRPSGEENRWNAWYWKTSIKEREEGKLENKKIALKDNVNLAQIPMMNGSALLEDYIADEDATLVTRILAAGGEITGKAVCENLCLSGASHTAATGPVLNPHDPTRTSGGSSSGSAVLVAAGEVDMAIGGDQGGSIRIPSAWCGVYGLKPTHGLVPYTGIFPIEQTLDHAGPIARNTEDVALLLEVIAGPDGFDPRQSGLQPKAYTKALIGHAHGLNIGIVREGFGWENLSEPDVDQLVREASFRLRKAGADVGEFSLPYHREGVHIWNAIAIEGTTSLMINGNGMGTNWKGRYNPKLAEHYGKARKSRVNDYSETVKMLLLLGTYLQEHYHGHYYAKARNLANQLKLAYDQALEQFDVLLMPTVPMKATKIPAPSASKEEYISRALEMIPNTAPFNVTGHPAMSVPCGFSDGLPVGMMIIGRMGQDDVVLRVAHAFQSIHS